VADAQGGERYFDEARLPASWTTALEPRVGGHGLAFARATWWSFDPRPRRCGRRSPSAGCPRRWASCWGRAGAGCSSPRSWAVWAVQVLTTVATHGGLPRYSAQLLPLTFLLTIAGTTVTVRAILAGAQATRRR
jgi:hypothetical protein